MLDLRRETTKKVILKDISSTSTLHLLKIIWLGMRKREWFRNCRGKQSRTNVLLRIGSNLQTLYSDILLQNKVWWLSRGEVWKRFTTCVEHVKTFLQSKGQIYAELEYPDWLEKLHFVVDMTSHLNTLNKSLQGKGSTALQTLEGVLVFESKLTVFTRDVQRGTPPWESSKKDTIMWINTTVNIYNGRWSECKLHLGKDSASSKRKKLHYLSLSHSWTLTHPCWTSTFTGVSQPDLEIELADIADKDLRVSKFKSLTTELEEGHSYKWSDIENLQKPNKLVFERWTAIPDNYMNMKKYAFGVLSIFGSTYLCNRFSQAWAT